MRKSVTKTIKATVAFAMAIGAGVGAAISSPSANPVYADYAELYNASFVSVADHSYTQNKTFTLGGKSWTSSVSQVSSSVFYLGCNSSNASKGVLGNNDTFSEVEGALIATGTTYTSGTSHAYGLLFNNSYSDVTKVVFGWSGGNNAFQVYLFGKTALGYVQLGYTNYATSGASTAGNVTWTGDATSYTGFAIAAKPGTPTTNATSKTLRASSFVIYETNSGGSEQTGFTVSFDGNGGSGSMSSVSEVSGNYSLPNSEFVAPSGKAFIGWKAGNAGDLLAVDDEYEVTENVTFYAQWEDRYTVKYNANGGSGTINDSNSYVPSATVTVKANTFTAPFADQVFDKWNTAANGSGQDYDPADTFAITANTTLYAQWKDDPSIPYTNVYRTGFESTDGFTATTTYNSEKDDGPSGKQWHIYYGTASTGSPLSGSQSLQMRWYGSSPESIPYIQTNFASVEVKRVTFNYKVNNKTVDFKTQYNTDGSNVWTDIETVDTPNTDEHTYRKIFATPVSTLYFRILCAGTAPTGSAKPEFRIDSFSIDSIATPSTINGADSVNVGSEWAPTSITENVGGALVSGVTYSFAASNGAVVSDSNTATGAFTCSSTGTVTVSAIKPGYLISDKVITVLPVESFINNLSKTSTTGFTGQNETITFSYGNLSGVLTVESNDDSVVTTSNLSQSAGSGLVQLNYVGAGSTTVSFKDGSTEKASVTVTVTASSVTITGMPASKLMGNGTSLNLGAYITVSAVGTCSNTVNWSSTVNGVATVNSSGVVAAVSVGSTVITVTPEDYPAGAVSCTVTVVNEKAVLATSISNGDTVFLGSQAASMQYNGPSSTSTVFGLGVAFVGAPNVGGIALEVEDGSVADSFALRIKSGDYADKYLTWIEENSLNVADVIDDNSSWNISIDGSGNASITNVNTPARKIWWNVTNPRFACYTGKSNGEGYKYVQLWKQVNPESYYNPASTVNTIHGRENYTADVLTSVDSVVIRFGATIAKSNWDAIKASWEITDYGVMLMRKTDLDDNAYLSVQEAFEDNASSSILKIINKRAGGAAYADPYLDGDDYLFTVRVNFQDDAKYYDDVIYAVPFVVAGGQYYFFNEMHTSVQELALNYYNTGYTYLSDEALEILIGD